MKNLSVNFNHKTGNDNIIIKIDDSVLESSIDNQLLAQFIEMQEGYEELKLQGIVTNDKKNYKENQLPKIWPFKGI